MNRRYDNLIIHLEQPFFCTGCGITFEEQFTAHYCSHPENAYFDWEAHDELHSKDDEQVVVDEETGGMKGAKNIRLHATPWEALAELGRVFAFGESKYDDYNFRKGYRWSLSFDALQRHVWLFWNREDRDAESKLHHMAHAAWHALVLCFYSLTGRGTDDRPE